jgi:hypothetical protein
MAKSYGFPSSLENGVATSMALNLLGVFPAAFAPLFCDGLTMGQLGGRTITVEEHVDGDTRRLPRQRKRHGKSINSLILLALPRELNPCF